MQYLNFTVYHGMKADDYYTIYICLLTVLTKNHPNRSFNLCTHVAANEMAENQSSYFDNNLENFWLYSEFKKKTKQPVNGEDNHINL